MVDVKNEVVLSYEITDTTAGDGETLPGPLVQAEANLPPRRIKYVSYDKAADSDDVHTLRFSKGITPLIEIRALWKGKHESAVGGLPGHNGSSNVEYDEEGTVYCYDKISDPPLRHKVAYIGHEPKRGTLKYRCPAKRAGWEYPM
jgi:hypothetical protein